MKTTLLLVLVSVLAIVAAPAYSSEAMQMWKCEMDEDVTEQQVLDMAQDWLKAAKTMEGGENMTVTVYFPVAVNMAGDTDLLFVVHTPSFEEWGKFWDGYEDSPAAKVDQENTENGGVCPDSAMWEAFRVEVE